MNFSDKLRANLTNEVFSKDDISIIFNESSDEAIHSGISRSLKVKDILKLKRGYYLFGERLRKGPVSLYSIANKLYSPSYVSFESSLSHHGLIPEAVYVTTSACNQRKKKRFNSPVGEFVYDYIPCSPFFIGVEQSKEKGNALIANPLKALFDLIYSKKKRFQKLSDLEGDLRLDLEMLNDIVDKFSFKELEDLAKTYKKRIISDFFGLLARELK